MSSRLAVALVCGAMVAVSLPPFGWWPLALPGLGGLAWAISDQGAPSRLLVAAAFGLGQFGLGLWWLGEFSRPGAVLVILMEAAIVALAGAAAPPGPTRLLALPGALVLAEALRGAVPFGGLPLGGVALGQTAGPLAGVARVLGHLGVLAAAAVAGTALAAAAGRRWRAAAAALALAVAAAGLGVIAPDGGPATAALRVAAVQGGGPRGFRGVDRDPAAVFTAHLAASRAVRPPVDLVLWPEDVLDTEEPVAGTPEAVAIAALARRTGATVVVGVVEGAGRTRFRNAALAWSPTGEPAGRYDKVHRVPFGEYVPGRSLFDAVADLSDVPRDAIAGRGPGLLRTPAGDLGVLISYEVFYSGRARSGARAGGRLLVVPTNAASYRTSQVPTQEVAAARLRAVEAGRDLVQAAPTGYSAVVDHRGRVLSRSTLGRRQVLHGEVALRSGTTMYVRWGDAPILVLAVLAVGAAWIAGRRIPG